MISDKTKQSQRPTSKGAQPSSADSAPPRIQELQKQVSMLQTYQGAYEDKISEVDEQAKKIRNLEVCCL